MYTPYALSFLVLSIPALTSPVSSNTKIKVVYRWDMKKDLHGISAFGSTGYLIDAACGNSVATGSFATNPISFHMTQDGLLNGNISVGDAVTDVDCEQPECPQCGVAWNDNWAEVMCHVENYKFDMYLSSSSPMEAARSCFSSDHASGRLLRGDTVVDTSRAGPPPNTTLAEPTLDERDTQATVRQDTIVVNDGNPHQRAWNYQLTKRINCGDGTCSAGVTDTQTFTWNFMANAELYRWISAGFNVGRSQATAEAFTCNAAAHQTVCLWHVEDYTSYTVQNEQLTCSQFGCSEPTYSDDIILDSPNNVQVTTEHLYCVRGSACRTKGEGYFTLIKAGGPP